MNKLVLYAGLYTASAALLKLIGFFMLLWLARTLPVDSYANFGLLYAMQTGITTFSLVGILEAVIGLLKEHRSDEQQNRLFAVANSAFYITLTASIVLSFLFLVPFTGNSDFTIVTSLWVIVSGALLAYALFQAQIVRLEEKHLSSVNFNFTVPFAGLTGSFIAFYLDRTIHSFYLGSAIGLLAVSAVLWSSGFGFYGIAPRLAEIRPILVRILPFIPVAFLGWLGGYGNNYVIHSFFELKEVAKFTFALSLSSIMQLIATALNQVWSPRFYRITHELAFDQVEHKNRRFYRIQGLAMGCIGGMVIALFPFTMKVLGGNLTAYKNIGLELFCLFSAYIVLTPWWHCSNYFLAYDKGSSIMRIVLVSSLIGIIVWLLLMWFLGPIGIYIGFFTQMLLRTLLILHKAKNHWPVKASWDGVFGGVSFTFFGFLVSLMNKPS